MKTYILASPDKKTVAVCTFGGSDAASLIAQHGEEAGLLLLGEKMRDECADYAGWSVRVVDVEDLPGGSGNEYDKTFRAAWTDEIPGRQVDVDIPRAQEIAHGKRREKRAAELAPLDAELNQVRGRSAAAINADKEAILSKYDKVQSDIDLAATVDELKAIISW